MTSTQSIFSGEKYTKEEALAQLPFGSAVENAVAINEPVTNPKYSAIFRNAAHLDRMVQNVHPDLNTHYKLFNNAAEMYRDRPCLGKRPYNYTTHQLDDYFLHWTYGEVFTKKNNIGAGFIRALLENPFLDVTLESHRKIVNHLRDWPTFGINKSPRENLNYEIEKNCSFILTIFAVNRAEWILTDLACSSYAITNTALYDTLGPDVSQYILNLTESPIVVCTHDKIQVLLNLKRKYPEQTKNLISIVSMDPIDLVTQGTIEQAYELGVTIQGLNQIEKIGVLNPIQQLETGTEALFTISFTSGTTGSKPKGVMISQGGAAAYVTWGLSCCPQAKPGDKAYIFLPLTHLYERETCAFAYSSGYYLGFPQINLGKKKVNPFENMLNDLRIFKPTYMSMVPRLLTRLEALIKSKIKELPQADQDRVNGIIEIKIREQSKADGAKGFDATLDNDPTYKSLAKFVGYENMRWVQTASAPIAPTTLVYLKASLNIGARQQYGLTESGAAITSTGEYEASPGGCGVVLPTGQCRLYSVSEMGYSLDKLEGEVLLQGPQMFKGYYYNYEETENAVTEDGWFHSGDIARVDPATGRLDIIDRVKHFFKLAQGEYISPERIENRYLSSNPDICQLWVHGDSKEHYLIGIVGVEYEKGLKFINEEFGYNKIDMQPDDLLDILNSAEVKARFLSKLNRLVKDKLNGFEILHNIFIEFEPLTVQREVVTPTFKIRRPICRKFFKAQLDAMYAEGSLISAAKL
ncbi:Long-chain-fatty-acid--CoA ligase 2 [Candida viswanathii]|uniref:Long-chain-fatty-acid--CoA ligase 2 n=1 Tax=Candida viswanathii TaxID=5486 RepID=A0A367XVQ7_9ASCO|nr:Long-chain-fatty-acid--CoA ligase 2 [Candida viswanathii]